MQHFFAIPFLAALSIAAILCAAPSVSRASGVDAASCDDRSAVIFAYHRIGEDQFPDTNIRREQFEAHVEELSGGAYNVLPLQEIVQSLRTEKKLAPATVALTFDGGHRSLLEIAAPLLIEKDLPFTVFIATDKVDADIPNYLNWKDIRKLGRSDLVSFGLHPAAYRRLTDRRDSVIAAEINKAKARFREKAGRAAPFFAYPFGEYGMAYRDIIAKSGFAAAFGQDSAVAFSGMDLFGLPRFSMTEGFATLERFRLLAHALPLPVLDFEPKDPHVRRGTNDAPLSIGFTLPTDLQDRRRQLSCFTSEPGRPVLEFLGEGRVELRSDPPALNSADDALRIRVNCTMPARRSESQPHSRRAAGTDAPPAWRWFGRLLTLSMAESALLTEGAKNPENVENVEEPEIQDMPDAPHAPDAPELAETPEDQNPAQITEQAAPNALPE